MKAFADDKMKLAKMKNFVFGRVENIVGRGENAGYQYFFLFPTMFFKKLFTRGRLKLGLW